MFTDFFAVTGRARASRRTSTAAATTSRFINAGIPAGGLFTGAEGIKSARAGAGSTAGPRARPYDPCYHAACDDITNIDEDTLDLMSDAIAHSTLTFAETTSAVNGTGKGNGTGKIDWQFKGNHALR